MHCQCATCSYTHNAYVTIFNIASDYFDSSIAKSPICKRYIIQFIMHTSSRELKYCETKGPAHLYPTHLCPAHLWYSDTSLVVLYRNPTTTARGCGHVSTGDQLGDGSRRKGFREEGGSGGGGGGGGGGEGGGDGAVAAGSGCLEDGVGRGLSLSVSVAQKLNQGGVCHLEPHKSPGGLNFGGIPIRGGGSQHGSRLVMGGEKRGGLQRRRGQSLGLDRWGGEGSMGRHGRRCGGGGRYWSSGEGRWGNVGGGGSRGEDGGSSREGWRSGGGRRRGDGGCLAADCGSWELGPTTHRPGGGGREGVGGGKGREEGVQGQQRSDMYN